MSASEPTASPAGEDRRAALISECTTVLGVAAATERIEAARQVGAYAAERGFDQRELVDAFFASAASYWSGHHERINALATLREVVLTSFDGYHQRTRSELTARDEDRTDFINDLLTGRTDPGALAQRAQRYGVRLPGAHTVIVARGTIDSALARQVDAALATRFGEGNTLTSRRDQDLVCITAGGLRGVPAELAHQLLQSLAPGSWQIGVGRTHHGLRGVATSLDEARNALDLAARLGFTLPILQAADLLVFPVLLRDREAITDLVNTVLGPLLQARGGARPFLQTLAVLFDNQGNYTATARDLHLSVRAVTYRLDRVRALTGYHPGEPTQRFTLHAAVLGARLLDWPPTAATEARQP